MKNQRTIFHQLLALDSIYRVLSFEDRLYLHRCIAGKIEDGDEGSERIFKLNEIVKKKRWKSPEMKYPEFHPDQLYYRNEKNDLIPLEVYPINHPQISELIETTFKHL